MDIIAKEGRTKRALAAALIIKDGRMLLLQNIKHGQARVEPPGGKIPAGETIVDALKREVREETGLTVGECVFFRTYPTHSPEGEFQVHMYLCEILSGVPELKEPEKFSGLGWYGFEDLLEFKKAGALVPNLLGVIGELEELLRLNADGRP